MKQQGLNMAVYLYVVPWLWTYLWLSLTVFHVYQMISKSYIYMCLHHAIAELTKSFIFSLFVLIGLLSGVVTRLESWVGWRDCAAYSWRNIPMVTYVSVSELVFYTVVIIREELTIQSRQWEHWLMMLNTYWRHIPMVKYGASMVVYHTVLSKRAAYWSR